MPHVSGGPWVLDEVNAVTAHWKNYHSGEKVWTKRELNDYLVLKIVNGNVVTQCGFIVEESGWARHPSHPASS